MIDGELSQSDYLRFTVFLEKQCGIVLGGNKLYLVRSRLISVVRETGMESLSKLVQTVLSTQNSDLKNRIVDAMTTNETLWFRDKYPFDILDKQLFKSLSTTKRKLRIWSAACSSGQEPYSIAMLVLEYKKKHPNAFSAGVEIIATDLSSKILTQANEAKYDALSIKRGLPENLKNSYFTASSDGFFSVKPEVKQMVKFKSLNLLDSYTSIGNVDIVFCRNVLIYFSQDNKRKILQHIAACLQSDGILFLGASESLSDAVKYFTMQRSDSGLFYKKK